MPTNRDRRSNKLLVWVSIIGGMLMAIGTVLGAVIVYGDSRAARQAQQDEFNLLKQRVYDLEHANYTEHGNYGQLPNAVKEPPQPKGRK